MFERSVTARYLLRGGVAALLAFCSALVTALDADHAIDVHEWSIILLATVSAFAAYLGIGAAVPHVEPFVGNKLDRVDVPKPPARPEPPG